MLLRVRLAFLELGLLRCLGWQRSGLAGPIDLKTSKTRDLAPIDRCLLVAHGLKSTLNALLKQALASPPYQVLGRLVCRPISGKLLSNDGEVACPIRFPPLPALVNTGLLTLAYLWDTQVRKPC